jgi:N-acetylglucosamine kinase-like BadF-type ATPase
MRLVLGFDGGGTKTECVLMDDAGNIVARGRSGPSNPTRVGPDRALASLQAAAQDALLHVPSESQYLYSNAQPMFSAVVAGLAGTGRPELAEKMLSQLQTGFPGSSSKVCTDLDLALAAAGDGPAIILVGGTGSAAMGRDAQGQTARAGGLGPASGDEGSAYDTGKKAVLAAIHDLEETGEDSALGKQILRQLGCSAWPAVQMRVSAAADEVYPRVFPVVAAAADAGDRTARTLLTDAAHNLSALVKNVVAQLGLGDSSFLLAKTGGMFGRSAFFDAEVDKLLREAAPQARISTLPIAPAEAAARMALRLLSTAHVEGTEVTG